MIETSEDLEEISSQASISKNDIPPLKYIPPSEVSDIGLTKELALQLYQDEDTRGWQINSAASVVLGVNAILAAILPGFLDTNIPTLGIFLAVIFLICSIVFSINSLRPRTSQRPKILGDTAKSLGLNKLEYDGVLAYTYANSFYFNRRVNNRKQMWLKFALLATIGSLVVLAVVGVIVVALQTSWFG